MVMARNDTDLDAGLVPFFAAAEAEAVPGVPDDLMARILADAAAAQPRPVEAVVRPAPGLIETFLAALGGWPAAAGLAVVAGMGVFVGYSPPDVLTNAFEATSLLGSFEDGTGSMLAGYDAFLEDG